MILDDHSHIPNEQDMQIWRGLQAHYGPEMALRLEKTVTPKALDEIVRICQASGMKVIIQENGHHDILVLIRNRNITRLEILILLLTKQIPFDKTIEDPEELAYAQRCVTSNHQ